jgi:hypothetical protein
MSRAAAVLAAAVLAAMALAAGATAAPIAYPDLQVLMPTNDMYVVASGGQRTLEFTHITSDLGAGPLEIRPSYNAATGIAQGYQALYTEPKPGTWTFDHTVPIVGPMRWVPPSDYAFPLDRFWLYDVGTGGGPGRIVASSPKVDFCMTSDTFVGGVPDAPAENEYPSGECSSPEGRLGLTVGWGDQYEATDGGEGIDISNLPNGTYWLRGEVDPYHYLQESNTGNDITDTKLQIEGTKVTVLEQRNPDSTPPAVTLTSPGSGASVSGSATLTAAASGPASISSVQFLLDGRAIGTPVKTAPYTLDWNVGSTTPGFHYLSAQATDARGFIGTAPAQPITIATRAGSVVVESAVSQKGKTSVTSPAFSVAPGAVLLAFANSDGPATGHQTMSVSGAGLTWSLVARENSQPGDAEIWTATAASGLVSATVTSSATFANYSQGLAVVALKGAEGIGASATAAAGSGAPTVSLFATQAGSTAFATGTDWDKATARVPAPEQALLTQILDTSNGDTYWSQYLESPSTSTGQVMTLSDTSPTSDRWDLAAVEVHAPAPPPDTEPPTVAVVNPAASQTVSGTAQVAAEASDDGFVRSVQFYLDGHPLSSSVTQAPYAVSWNTAAVANGAHTLTAVAVDGAGNVGESAPVDVVVQNPALHGPCFVMDANATAEGTGAVTTGAITTAEAGEQLLAFVSSGGPHELRQTAKVTGGGLEWKLVRRANGQAGDVEIWHATAAAPLSGVTFTSTPARKGYEQTLTVIAMQMSLGIGHSAGASAASGEPRVSLLTSEAEDLVFAVGEDPSDATGRTPAANQVLLHQSLDTAGARTFWTQYTGQITGKTGSLLTMGDTAPATDAWNMAAVELRGDGPGA